MSDTFPRNNPWFREIPTPITIYQAISLWRVFFLSSFIKNLVNIDPHNFVTDIGVILISNPWVIKQLKHRQLFSSCNIPSVYGFFAIVETSDEINMGWKCTISHTQKIIPNSFLSEFYQSTFGVQTHGSVFMYIVF